MTKVLSLVKHAGNKATADTIREYADKVESGEIQEILMVCELNGEYNFLRYATLVNSLVMANLLQDKILTAFKEIK